MEEYAEAPDYDQEEYCNIGIKFSNGAYIGLNVWSEKYFRSTIQNQSLDEHGMLPLPDLVIHKLEPSAIRKLVTRLVTEDKWLGGRGFPCWDAANEQIDSDCS